MSSARKRRLQRRRRKCKMWTDYPFTELADTPNEIAPIRRCRVMELFHPDSKYIDIRVFYGDNTHIDTTIKRWYLYDSPRRLDSRPSTPRDKLRRSMAYDRK